jgi:hypothetical protein
MSNIKEAYNRYQRQDVSGYNKTQFDQNSFDNAYNAKFNEQLSVSEEPDIVYEKVNNYLSISSRERDTTDYPNPNHYTVFLKDTYKNIYSIELLQAIIPAKNSVEAEPYLLLKIDELEDVMSGNDRHMSDAFAILQMAPPTTPGGFIQIDKRIHENTVKYFKVPKASLGRLSVTITDCDGIPFDFGADNATPLRSLQNTFVFKIITLEKTRKTLNHRNLY